jgi:hypothetical protein
MQRWKIRTNTTVPRQVIFNGIISLPKPILDELNVIVKEYERSYTA